MLVLVVAAVGYLLRAEGESAVLPSPGAQARGVDDREDAAAELLAELSSGLAAGDRDRVLALAAAGDRRARAELAAILANVRRLGVTDLSMRYLDENAGRRVRGVPAARAELAWVADVELTWRIDGYEQAPSNVETTLTLLDTDDGARFVSARGSYGQQTPLWLLDRLRVLRGRRTLVMVDGTAAEARTYAAMARRAVRDVGKVLPGWDGALVVEVPGSQRELTRVLSSESEYGAIAAVTSPVDGSLAPSSPHHVFVNPPVFDPLGERGAQIVISHEAAHVATDAAISGVPTWLLEGFADYVALAHVDLPVSVVASQILAEVRRDGPPRRLPDERDFASENTRLGASYEAAWLACRLIARRYGEAALIEFYRAADRDGGTERAFREVLGTTQARLTAAWRAELRRLAG